jgi:hypothetical protein
VFRAHVNVDQVYAVAHLRDRAAGYNAIQSQRHVLGAEPELARLVLIDAYAHDARRLGPIEVDVAYPSHRLQLLGNLQRNVVHAREVRSADAVFDGPADGRPKLERIDACDRRGKSLCDGLLQTRAHLVTLPAFTTSPASALLEITGKDRSRRDRRSPVDK